MAQHYPVGPVSDDTYRREEEVNRTEELSDSGTDSDSEWDTETTATDVDGETDWDGQAGWEGVDWRNDEEPRLGFPDAHDVGMYDIRVGYF